MKSTITLTAFTCHQPDHFGAGKDIIRTVRQCCEGLFGREQFRSACKLTFDGFPVGVTFALDTPEAQAMARILRHMLAQRLSAHSWSEETIVISARSRDPRAGSDN
jgi:hypothetical protein